MEPVLQYQRAWDEENRKDAEHQAKIDRLAEEKYKNADEKMKCEALVDAASLHDELLLSKLARPTGVLD